jgi:DDE superfamily endonuclease
LKALANRTEGWVFGFQDEVWFSRLAQPSLHAWTPDEPLRLHLKDKEKKDKEKTAKAEAEALACYGLLREDNAEMMLRFVEGRPVSAVTIAFLEWATTTLAAQGVQVLVMAWDNASWHVSAQVKTWIREHNRSQKKARERGEKPGCRLLVCPLPVKSPWLNAIEPKWVHGKKNIVEPQRKLSSSELRQRLCDYYNTPLLPCIQQ